MIYLMHGFIGSGKTTRAKELERDLGALRITPDEWMAELFGDDPPADKFRHYQDVLCRRLEPIWTAHARGGANVILDFGFWSAESRREMEAYLRDNDLAFEWVAMETPLDECRRRNALRNGSGARTLNITDATFDFLAPRFEPMAKPI